MVKHTQTIRRQQTTDCLNVFDHFVTQIVQCYRQQMRIKDPVREPRLTFFYKDGNGFLDVLDIFGRKLHHRCLKRF